MTKLTDTQLLILTAAAQRKDWNALPLPGSLRGGAAKKLVGALLAKGYLAEVPASREAGTLVWDHDGKENPITLIATADGLSAIGIEPDGADAPEVDAAPDTAREVAMESQDGDAAAEITTAEADAPAGNPESDAAEPKARKVRTGTKQAMLIEMLRAPEGATIDEIATATGWQPHTVRGAIAGALKKKLGFEITSAKHEGRGRAYQIRT